jgi:hypothetical protein
MKTGIELISNERQRVIGLGVTVEHDVENNANKQLIEAISLLVADGGRDVQDNFLYEKMRLEAPPSGWNPKAWEELSKSDYTSRLIAAGQMIAAEIDRINHVTNNR